MSPQYPQRKRLFAAEGEVVEILEEAEARRAKVVLKPGTVIDVTAAKDVDVHLGDQIVVEGTIDGIRTRADDAMPVTGS